MDIYVSKCPVSDTALCLEGDYYPNTSSYLMTSRGCDEDKIVITRLSNDFSHTIYLVGVYSPDSSAEFQVSVHLEESVLMLQPGMEKQPAHTEEPCVADP